MAGDTSLVAQTDFSAGAFQGPARHLIPRNGLAECRNGLVDESGSVYKRGGAQLLSTADSGGGGRLPHTLFDGYLSAGRRTLFADASNLFVLDGADAPVTLPGGGLNGPKGVVVIGGCLIVAGKVYAGSLKLANYATGTISTTNGSAVITGAGTTWNTLVDAGMLLAIGSERLYVVKSVDSTTQITLTEAYEGTTAGGKAYALQPVGALPAAQTSDIYAVSGDRLVVVSGNVITFSNGRSPGGSGLPPAGQLRWQTFTATDRWQVPDGAQGLGAAALGETVFVFTTSGVYALANLAYDLTDTAGNLQQRLTHVNPELILWGGNAGIAAWNDRLVVPATEGIWLMGGSGAAQLLSLSIPARIRNHVALANVPGAVAVYRGHLIVPVVTPVNGWADLMVCRLDRPVETDEGKVFPWTWHDGYGAQVGAVAVRRAQGDRPRLLGTGQAAAAPGSGPSGVNFTQIAGGGLSDHAALYWKVTAIVAGTESAPSVEIGRPASSFGPVHLVSYVVSWNAVPGASGYRVYRGGAPGGEVAYFAVGAVTSFTDIGDPGTAGTPPAGGIGSRVLELSSYFEPGVAVKNDHDGSTHEFSVVTRDFTPERLNIDTFVRHLRMRYELVDAATDDPKITAWYSLGRPVAQALWGTAIWGTASWASAETSQEVQLATQAPEHDGTRLFTWTVGKRARLLRFRLRSVNPSASLKIRTLEVKSRPSGKV